MRGGEARRGGARKCTQWPECVSVSVCLCLSMGCKKMYSVARVCLCVYSSSWGARKCTQWPECVCVSIPLHGVQENVLNGQCVCLCVYSSSWGARKCTQWPVCVSVCLFLFMGCKKMCSMASVCVCVSIPLHGVQENVLNGQCVCLCVYSSSGGAWKCTQWPVCVSLSVCLFFFRGCKKMYSVASVCVCLSLHVSVCVCVSIPLLGSICHAKSNGQVLPWQSQQSTAGTPCPIASPTNVQACLSMFGAWVPMSVPYDIKNVIKFCERVYPHHRNACAFSLVTVGIKYQILKA